MTVLRHLLNLIRAVGVLALALLIVALMYPAQLAKRLGKAVVERTSATPAVPVPLPPPAAVQAVVQPVSGPPEREPSAAQMRMARWLGSKYRVSPVAIATLIVEADRLSVAYQLPPNLVIAVMAIESNFHPYIQSAAGAQGLMQVMPRIHAKRYQKFGGPRSFIDPIVSLTVGAEILRDCTRLRGGSETEALRFFYFGGGPASDAYIGKVQAERRRLDQIAAGQSAPAD